MIFIINKINYPICIRTIIGSKKLLIKSGDQLKWDCEWVFFRISKTQNLSVDLNIEL